MSSDNIFDVFDFQQHFSDSALGKLQREIGSASTDYLLAVNRDEYVKDLVDKYSFDAPTFDFDNVSVDEPIEVRVWGIQFPPNSIVDPDRDYAKPVYRYYLPYSGDENSLRAIPNPRIELTHWVRIDQDAVSFDVIDFYNNAEGVRSTADSVLSAIRQQAQCLADNVDTHNKALLDKARYWFDKRRLELAERQSVLTSLGVPIRRRDNIPETFAVPVIRKKVQVKPETPSPSVTPEPTLSDPLYQEILQVIHHTGQQFERMPSIYVGKDEEPLRDHFIMVLEPRFELPTTGETFNKAGKTDILIRHETRNVFVGECKFWRGQKAHTQTINQLLSYLTWRDSKTAIIYFMDTKEMVAPLRSIEESTPQHSCFVRLRGKREESWFDYDFHLVGDESRIVRLSILCFHFPPPSAAS